MNTGVSSAQVYRNDVFVLKIQAITKRQSVLHEKFRGESELRSHDRDFVLSQGTYQTAWIVVRSVLFQ